MLQRSLCRLPIVLSVLLALAMGVNSAAVPWQDQGVPIAVAPPTLADQLKSVGTELASIRAEIDQLSADAPADHRAALEADRGALERTELLLTQNQATAARADELTAQRDELKAELEQLRASGLSEPPPYSELQVDQLRDELEAETARADTLKAAVTASSAAVVEADQAFDAAESRRRKAAEAARGGDATALAALRRARLESAVAEATLGLRRSELLRSSVTHEIQRVREELIGARIELMAVDASFSRADLDGKLVEIETARTRARQRMSVAESTSGYLEPEWLTAKREQSTNLTVNPELAEEVAARRLALDAVRESIEALNKRLEQLNDAEMVWKRRYELTLRPSAAALKEWQTESTTRIDALNLEERLLSARADEIRTRLGTLGERLETLDPETDAAVLPWLREQQAHLRAINETLAARVQSVDSTRRLHMRLLSVVGVSASNVSFSERMEAVWQSVVSIWGFEVWTVELRPITVGKIVIGVLVLCLGLFASRRLSRFIGHRVLPRLGLNEGASAAVQSILFYLLAITFVLLAFRAVNIPLTAFTVLGGALAIGVGFGSQNIIANFISGLIIIAERPVRVGDLVEVDGLYGTVEAIGARSTRIRTGDNIDIVVPNSSFLEQNVINWTLTEDKIRTHVTVGVAYGSPTREVAKLLTRAAEEHGRVHKKPHPFVLFTEFGDNSLNFQVHFWITMKKFMDRRLIESDVRHLIDVLFKEAGIVIAFPQRDVHLDTVAPVDIRIISDVGAGGL